jgi:transcriptional regulator GlxA family with amidase domain
VHGDFLSAQAGLLENKRVARHWTICDMMQQLFPTLKVDSKAIFVQQGPIWTSAGFSSAIDLALAMIEADCGRHVAMHIARELVATQRAMRRRPSESFYATKLSVN